MIVQLLGYQTVDFTNKNGEQIRGSNIFVSFEDENVTGLHTEKFFIREGINLPEGTKIKDTIDLSFNMKGKVESIFATK